MEFPQKISVLKKVVIFIWYTMLMPQVLASPWWKCVFVWQDSFVVMTSNINFYVWTNFSTFCIALCVISQLFDRKITKNGSACHLRLKSYLENCPVMKIIPVFANDTFVDKQCGNKICKQENFVPIVSFHHTAPYLSVFFRARFFWDTQYIGRWSSSSVNDTW